MSKAKNTTQRKPQGDIVKVVPSKKAPNTEAHGQIAIPEKGIVLSISVLYFEPRGGESFAERDTAFALLLKEFERAGYPIPPGDPFKYEETKEHSLGFSFYVPGFYAEVTFWSLRISPSPPQVGEKPFGNIVKVAPNAKLLNAEAHGLIERPGQAPLSISVLYFEPKKDTFAPRDAAFALLLKEFEKAGCPIPSGDPFGYEEAKEESAQFCFRGEGFHAEITFWPFRQRRPTKAEQEAVDLA